MKKKNYVTILLIIFIIPLMAFTCRDKVDNGHKYIAFINSSNDTIYVYQKPYMRIPPADTLYDCNSIKYKVLPKDTCFLPPTNDYWETDFKTRNILMYFVFPKEASSYGSCEEIQKQPVKRYQLTKEDLEKTDWIITYP